MRVERLGLDPVEVKSSSVDDSLGGYQDTEALGVFHPRAARRTLDELIARCPPGFRLLVNVENLNRRFMQATKAEGNAGSDEPR